MHRLRSFFPIITLFMVVVFVLGGCIQQHPAPQPKTIIKGKVETLVDTKAIIGQALANATVNVIDPVTNQIVASGTTGQDGQFSIEVPPGGPYLVQAKKGNIKIMKVVTPALQEGDTRDIGLCDSTSTALALIFEELVSRGNTPAGIDLDIYRNNQYFSQLLNSVNNALLNGDDPGANKTVNQYIHLVLDGPSGGGGSTSIPTYTVTYHANGGSNPPAAVQYYTGQQVMVKGQKSMTWDYHTFNGWNTQADGSGVSFDEGDTFIMPNHDVTLYAKWIEFPKYTVSYDAGLGSNPPAAVQYYAGQNVLVSGPGSMTQDYCIFVNWTCTFFSSSIEHIYYPGDTFIMPDHDVTLYATWKYKPIHSVTYDANSGTNPPLGVKYIEGQTVTVKDQGYMTRDSYTFVNWNTQSDGHGTSYVPGDTFTMGTEDVTLYAQWREQEVTHIAVTTQPNNLSYVEGQELDLSGLVVTLTYKDSSTETVTYSPASFRDKGIIVNPAHGTQLTAWYNDKPVILTCNGQYTYTENLTVVAKADQPIGVDERKLFITAIGNNRIKIESNYGDVITNSTGVVILCYSGKFVGWRDFGGKLQIRVSDTSNWNDNISSISLYPDNSLREVGIGGSSNDIFQDVTVTFEIRDKDYPTVTKSFFVKFYCDNFAPYYENLRVRSITVPN